MSLTEERRVVTVLFADLVGFTSLSEHRDPEAVKRVVDGAFEGLVRDVNAFGGRVDKIVGDAIVALFGAPVAHEDDAERAVRAALRMQETLEAYGREAGIDIRMRVGVNTGEVLVGALRAGGDYTAMGDVVNLASRLQTAASPGEVVVGDRTHRVTEDAVLYEPRGQLTARGREQSEHVWAAASVLRPPGRSRRVADAPLVGRQSELSVLLNAARGSIRHSRAQVLLLIGEAGVGKTRLAEELATALQADDDVMAFSGRCLPYGEVNPWWPIAEVLREACGTDADAPLEDALRATRAAVEAVVIDDAGEVDAVVDGLLHVMGHDGPLRGLDGTAARAEAVRALLTFLEGSLRRGAILVRLADLHWADDAVFELIDELSTRLARQPLVFVGTARRALQGRWTPRPGRFNSLLLNVDPLDRRAVHELLDHLTDDSLDPDTREMLLDRSGGNPFYLEELVTLVQRGAPASGSTGTAPVELPETLRGLIAARIDGLSAEEQSVLGDAAVWGASGPLVALDRIAEATRGVSSVASEVQGLADKDVMMLDGTRWSFRSDLVREVTYSRLTKSDRLKGHAGIAGYLDRATADRVPDDALVEAVSRHYVEAVRLVADLEGDNAGTELLARAVHWALEAARRAERGGSWPLANRLYSRALELVGPESIAERVGALLGRSRVQAEQWNHDGALADARAALALADEVGSTDMRASALLGVAAAEMRRSEWAIADSLLAEALETYDALGDTSGRGETLRQQGLAYLLRGDHRSAESPILGALEAFRAVHDRRGEGWAFQSLAWIAFGDGRIERAEQFIAASRDAFTEVGDRGGLQWTLGLSAFVHFMRGRFEPARDLAQKVLIDSERRGDRFGTGMMHLVLGGVELWSGHPPAAVGSAGHAMACLRADTDAVGMEQALTLLGRALIMGGDVRLGLERLREALDVGRRTSTRFAQAVAQLTEVQLGRPGLLLHDFDPGASPGLFGDGPGEAPNLASAVSLLQMGKLDDAVAEMRAARGEAEDAGHRVSLALVCAAAGEVAEARQWAQQVLDDPQATYHDRVFALVVEGLLDRGESGAVALGSARAILEDTEDRLTPTLVDLADAVRGRRGGRGGTHTMADIESALSQAGLADTAWREVFTAIADNSLAAEAAGEPTPAGRRRRS